MNASERKNATTAVIRRHLTRLHVNQWLNGSTYKADHITRAELESCGYRIVKVEDLEGYDLEELA